jgi:hypothetical protein
MRVEETFKRPVQSDAQLDWKRCSPANSRPFLLRSRLPRRLKLLAREQTWIQSLRRFDVVQRRKIPVSLVLLHISIAVLVTCD